jgi:hypothetical protein
MLIFKQVSCNLFQSVEDSKGLVATGTGEDRQITVSPVDNLWPTASLSCSTRTGENGAEPLLYFHSLTRTLEWQLLVLVSDNHVRGLRCRYEPQYARPARRAANTGLIQRRRTQIMRNFRHTFIAGLKR